MDLLLTKTRGANKKKFIVFFFFFPDHASNNTHFNLLISSNLQKANLPSALFMGRGTGEALGHGTPSFF